MFELTHLRVILAPVCDSAKGKILRLELPSYTLGNACDRRDSN